MPRSLLALLLVLAPLSALAVTPTAGAVAVAAPAAAPAPTHTLSVSGTGVGSYPAFSPAITRYAVTTTDATDGELTISAATSDPTGVVLVDGEPLVGGQRTLSGLTVGDEVSVIFQDSGGSEPHALVYLPTGFPVMEVAPGARATAPGSLLMNLSRYALGTPNFEVAMDDNGVPSYVRSFPNADQSADLKVAPDGHYTVMRSPTTTPGKTGSHMVELDSQFQEVGDYETAGSLVDTDQHDGILRPDGSRILIAYEPNQTTGKTDPVIQEISPTGQVVYTWNAADHLDPADLTVDPTNPDYGHLNSIQQLPDGDIVASFRLFSAVLKIAWSDRGSVHKGDVLWELGGRHSDFTFTDDPYGGPCAQHQATLLPNGHVLLFDNGSGGIGPAYCVDQSDPSGPAVTRPQSRAVEYALDETDHTATPVWSYEVPGRYTLFAGSAQRLSNGDTLIGWAADTSAVASEVDSAGHLVWVLRGHDGYFAYRVQRASVPDTQSPTLAVTGAPDQAAAFAYGASVTQAAARCTDRGGSTLRECSTTRIDTTAPGRHTFVARAVDGAGNVTTMSRSYTVAAAPFSRPDAVVRLAVRTAWTGNGTYDATAGKQLVTGYLPRRGSVSAAVVRVQAEGNRTDTYRLTALPGTARFAVRYLVGGADVTSAITGRSGWRRTMAAGGHVDVVVRVTRLRAAHLGAALRRIVRAASVIDRRRADSAGIVVRARHRP